MRKLVVLLAGWLCYSYGMKQPAPSYILCTAPRSGSTLMCSLLAASGAAGAPESYFHGPSVSDWAAEVGLNVVPGDDSLPTLRTVFAAIRRVGEAGTGVFGLRLQRGSVATAMTQLDRLFPGHATDADRLNAAFGAPRYVHLRRADTLGQAISRVRAEQTGLWHRRADGSELERLAPPAEPVFDRARIAAALAQGERLTAEWDDWFAQQGIVPLRLSYEDLSADPQATLARVLGHIGQNPARARGVAPGTARLADAVSDDWRARFLAG
ncbi:Stf0 family sulfotransferase [Pararhodobacter zhoushanensis]|uniref:Stf0 family sulfotransferase n=1 Tax=Pararhodobacter zhoushanensis TaxID=2479545 RepID=UPI001C70AE83|nr:Stf0 family sulfotransferase [Pararhodobacter zhoushanensis]